jgi:hypothetical protein
MDMLVYPICKEFLGLLFLLFHCTTVYCKSLSAVNIRPLRAFFIGPKMWKWHGRKSRLYAGCLIASRCMAYSWSWILSNLTDSIILLHGSVRLYVVHRVRDQLNAMQWEGLKHSDLLPYDFYISGPLIF